MTNKHHTCGNPSCHYYAFDVNESEADEIFNKFREEVMDTGKDLTQAVTHMRETYGHDQRLFHFSLYFLGLIVSRYWTSDDDDDDDDDESEIEQGIEDFLK